MRWTWAFLALFATSAFAADFSKGETLDFTLEFLSIDAGTARMTIAPQSDNAAQ